jgi:DNA-binding transcriptional LysR family regulator
MSVQKSLVLGGHGWTILPSIAIVDDVASGRLSAAPFSSPTMQRKIVLARPAMHKKTAPTACVEAALVNCMKHSVRNGEWPATRWLDLQDELTISSC